MARCQPFGTIGVRVILGLLVIALGGARPATAAAPEEADPPAFEWNVFLKQWRVIGPFPKPDRRSSGLDMECLATEPEVDLHKPVSLKDKQYEWATYRGHVVDFKHALRLEGKAGEYMVGYAWTEFSSPESQPAILALGYDDSMRAWLNGEEVHRFDEATSCSLDQATVEVTLRKGKNTLLLKVGQRYGVWASVVRLRPARIDKPLVVIGCDRRPGSGTLNLPTLDLDLLDAEGKRIETLRASGYRVKDPARILFSSYGHVPEPEPVRVRIRYRHRGLAEYDQTVAWSKVRDGQFKIKREIKIHIMPVNDPPGDLTITMNQAYYFEEDEIILNRSADDPDLDYGDVLVYDWYNGEEWLGVGSEIVFTLPEGTWEIRLKVTDSQGLSTSAFATIRVFGRADPPDDDDIVIDDDDDDANQTSVGDDTTNTLIAVGAGIVVFACCVLLVIVIILIILLMRIKKKKQDMEMDDDWEDDYEDEWDDDDDDWDDDWDDDDDYDDPYYDDNSYYDDRDYQELYYYPPPPWQERHLDNPDVDWEEEDDWDY